MSFEFFLPTKLIVGDDCVKENSHEFNRFGKKALIVTGKASAKKSGALDDVIESLKKNNIIHYIFSDVENNPSLKNVKEGGVIAKKLGVDFIVAIGGGSPLDASKAIAVLAKNDIEPIELFSNKFDNIPLPIIAIPTTAGTGSEVTPYSILTRDDIETKQSFGNENTFPKVSFIDAKYTESLSWEITVNTAVDALSHAVEGYICKKSTPVSDIFAIEAIKLFGDCINPLLNDDINIDVRKKLIYLSTLAGMVIAHTGTTIIHGIGYSLTYFKDIPHGKANGILMKEYFEFNYSEAKEKIDQILSYMKIKDLDELGYIMDNLVPTDINLSEEELKKYAEIAIDKSSTKNNIKLVKEEDIVSILRKSIKE